MMRSLSILAVLACVLAALPDIAMAARYTVDIPPAMQACTRAAECVMVDTDCGECCNFNAIAKSQRSAFETHKQQFCALHADATECNCTTEATYQKKFSCVKNRCQVRFVKKGSKLR